MLVFEIVAGMLFGLLVLGFGLPLVPGLIDSLVIKPNDNRPEPNPLVPDSADFPPNYPPNRWGFFTFLEPGQVKIVTKWGGGFIRAMMDHVGWAFVGERSDNDLQPSDQDYWEVDKSQESHTSHPLAFPMPKGGKDFLLWLFYAPLSVLWWVWKRYVYKLTGAVWVGIPYFRTLLIYRFERAKQFTERYEDAQHRPATRESLRPTWDYSDHLRVAQFPFAVLVAEADTQNMVPVRALFNEVARVKNPVKTAFNSDNRWPKMYQTAITDAISATIRSRPIAEVTAARDSATANQLTDEITRHLQEKVAFLAMEIEQTQFIDVSPVSEDDAKKLGDKARAEVERDATLLRADGEAGRIEKLGKAVKEHPFGETLLQTEALVATAEKLKDTDAMVFLGGQAGVDPMQAAILKELRKGNEPRVANENGATAP